MIKSNNGKNKRLIIYVLTIVFSILYLLVGRKVASTHMPDIEGADNMRGIKAKVIEIVDRNEEMSGIGVTEKINNVTIEFKAKALSGKEKGKELICEQNIEGIYENKLKEVEKGDKVLLYPNESNDSKYDWFLGDYLRVDSIVWLIAVFFVLLIIFGRTKGVNTIVSLLFTTLSVIMVFIPSIITGKNIYFWSILTCLFVIVVTLIVVNGANKKSLAAGIGCISGVLVAGIITTIMDKIINLTGYLNAESGRILYINPDNPINLRALVFAGIIIGAVGAIMDVAMSISSSLYELNLKVENISSRNLIKSGLAIGRDIMGTMANTLVLAYIGSSLSIVVLFSAYKKSALDLFNLEVIVVEFLQAIVGSMGILFAIPFTTLICSILYLKKSSKNNR